MVQGTAFIVTLFPGYSKRRHWVIYLMRLPAAIGTYVTYATKMTRHKELTFLQAAWITGYSYARFKLGFAIGLLYPVPVRGYGILFQTILVGVLLQSSEAECLSIQNDLPDFRVFVAQLEQVYALWQRGGEGPSCAFMCGDVLSGAVNQRFCSAACSSLLPLILSVYGKPWTEACVRHRYICLACGGYIIPLTVLYIWEMRDRWTFAKAHGLAVSGLRETMLRGAPPVLLDTVLALFVLLSVKLDY